ncbi:profilin [Tribonema minus]|uniref:Profilin n=1 Tax=Tribonema minus TaxID=303371 RepID=A0A835YUY9_9STRA|nr:profilin [Tribonema minus]
MSWNEYITSSLLSSGVIVQGAILGKADMQLYAEEGGFQLVSGYEAAVTNDDGSQKNETIDEVAAMQGFFESGSNPKFGFRMNQVKYQLMRKQDGPTLYLKCSSGGACVAATNTLVIVGIYKASGNDAMAAQVACNSAVENLADYLRQSSF